MHSLLSQPALCVMLAMVCIAAITDLKTGLIPNRVVAAGALAGVLVQLLAVMRGQAALDATLLSIALGFLLCSLVPLALYALGALGGGDLKLFAAIGLCAGPVVGLDIQVWAHLLAAAFVPFYLWRKGSLRSSLGTSWRVLRNLFRPAHQREPVERGQLTSLRFAPAIFLAALWVSLGSALP